MHKHTQKSDKVNVTIYFIKKRCVKNIKININRIILLHNNISSKV